MGATALLLGSAWALPAAAQWVEAPGRGWAQLALYHHDTRDEFGIDGNKTPIRNGGQAVATSLFITAAVGVVDGLDVWLQAPIHTIDYTDFGGDRRSTGVGDVWAHGRVAPLRWLGSDVPVAVRAGVKLPIGDFPLNAEVVPLGEGQRDWEVVVEAGRSFFPRSEYVMAWLGYRWREFDADRNRDFGDEVFFLAAVGGTAGPLGYKVTVEGWDGSTPLLEGVQIESASREMLHVSPTVSYPAGSGAVEVGVRLPIAGRNLTAGPALILGYFLRFGGS